MRDSRFEPWSYAVFRSKDGLTKHTHVLRFGLKQLFFGWFVIALLLAWWFKPYTIEYSIADGLMTFRSRVRRGLDGTIYHHGPVTLHYRNGAKGMETAYFGVPEGSVSFTPDEDEAQVRYWRDDGTELSFEEWYMYMSREYMPRELR